VDLLLELLQDLPIPDPPPGLRDRLSELAFQRLSEKIETGVQRRDRDQTSLRLLRPILFAALLVFIGIAASYVAYFRHRDSLQVDRAKPDSSTASPRSEPSTVTMAKPSKFRSPRTIYHARPGLAPAEPQQMTLRLPYSNSAIETGTGTTIRISMAQSELLSLGFPVTETLQDRRIAADLTLGDDGLPRAISLPLPFEVIKEKK
jgi:hypothetical protein